MEKILQASPKDVADSVKIFLRRKGTQKDAADALGITPATLSAQLAGKDYLSKMVAQRLSDQYGFDIAFLTAGVGKLFINSDNSDVILPNSFSIEFPSHEALPGGPDAKNRNASLWKAFDLMCKELNELRDRYMSIIPAMSDIKKLMSESEELTWAECIMEQIKTVKLPVISIL